MLKKLEVQNFKNFEHVVLDFGNVGEYNFNEEIIKNGILEKFFNFVDNMLWIRSLQEGNSYMGYRNGSQNIMKSIIEVDKVKNNRKINVFSAIPIFLKEYFGMKKLNKILIEKSKKES